MTSFGVERLSDPLPLAGLVLMAVKGLGSRLPLIQGAPLMNDALRSSGSLLDLSPLSENAQISEDLERLPLGRGLAGLS